MGDTPVIRSSALISCRMLWWIYKPSNVDTDLAPGSDLSRLIDKSFPGIKVHHIGRLDRDTSGLLLICADGTLTNRILSSSKLSKTYLARVSRYPDQAILSQLSPGTVNLGDGPGYIIKVEQVFETDEAIAPLFMSPNYQSVEQNNFFVRVTTREGRNRIVRRMLAAVGLPVLALHRERVGNITLKSDEIPGTIKPLKPYEISDLTALIS